ncbi:MAG: hypothetical protein UW30_C0008G0018 [Candidatus Giovannonibacteria bacterium GW2011_GWA2_44_13b]|uniref:Uncharacterized protein n=2 Tax=Candidatus Giovannoniibacteriota TaxID=1752738 RepID=A0A0G1K0T6_9BACT|nr:MAG: hypothetical protein UW30_C0008G0018 [Candidatus Giovannonibacteria bacterium GW2011_GWA2_44_13b]OGF82668.1 MAG: hypothetical protein A2924_00695 [Candidatus Giovannonibacteria bacterium RIFCSPLOWO2_01_FULL_44_16]
MSNVLIIPKELAQKGDLILVPRTDYEDALKVKERLLGEETDIDEAVRIFEKERKAGKLKMAKSFSEML